MWRNFSIKPTGSKPWLGIVLPVWVLAGFIFAQVLIGLLLALLKLLGVKFDGLNASILDTTIAAVIYIITLLVVIGLPWLVKKYRTTSKEIGIDFSPRWIHLLIAPVGFVAYVFISYILTSLAMRTPFYETNSVQDIGFANLSQGFEYILAFITLVIIAPVAEEILFRGYLLAKLRKHVPIWVAVLITSLLFAVVHLSFNVGVDVFALSLVLCFLRIKTGSLWPSIILHMIKNGIAFYFLFINPLLFPTLGG